MKFVAALTILAALAFPMSISSADVKTGAGAKADQASGGGQKLISALVVHESNTFARELYARLAADRKGNLLFSPSSIDTALAMTYAGASGNTARQMANTLHFTLPADKLSVAYGELVRLLNNSTTKPAPQPAYQRWLKGITGVIPTTKPTPQLTGQLVVANALWGQKGCAFKPAFTQLLHKSYGAGMNVVDFSQTEPARKTINDWVAKQTADKIKDLFPQGVLDERTRMVLTNAVYFKSKWGVSFQKGDTKDGRFKLSANQSVDVPLMHVQHSFHYMENDELQILEIPYVGDYLSMTIYLPRRVDGLPGIEKGLAAGILGKGLREAQLEVDLTLPKFTFSSEFMLNNILKAMGMTDAFDEWKADFSGITDKERLWLWAVVHKAFVAVDEEGTEAAAATGGSAVFGESSSVVAPPPPKIFKADHPFVFMIRHNSTGEILFMGRVANPKSE